MKILLRFWSGEPSCDSLIKLLNVVPSKQYDIGDNHIFKGKKLTKQHSYFDIDFTQDKVIDFEDQLNMLIAFLDKNSDIILRIKDHIDIAVTIVNTKPENNYHFGIKNEELEIISQHINWLSFVGDSSKDSWYERRQQFNSF